MKIQKGEYVRNESGYIHKIDTIEKLTNFYEDEENIIREWVGETLLGEVISEKIIKHSFNTIDLIKIKDIVEIQNISDKLCFKVEIFDEKTLMDLKLGIEENEIKLISILTQEQYKTNCYRLEG